MITKTYGFSFFTFASHITIRISLFITLITVILRTTLTFFFIRFTHIIVSRPLFRIICITYKIKNNHHISANFAISLIIWKVFNQNIDITNISQIKTHKIEENPDFFIYLQLFQYILNQ